MSSKTSAKSPSITDPISKIPYVGLKSAAHFLKLHIKTVEDLFKFAPRDVVDLSDPISVKSALKSEGQKVLILGEVEDLRIIKTPRRRIWITSAKISDKSGRIRVVWFHQPYLRNYFKNKKYVFYGLVEYSHFTKEVTMVSPEIYDEPGVIPIYHLTEGLSSKQIQRAVRHAVDAGYQLPEIIPDKLAKKFGLPAKKTALENLHFPHDKIFFNSAKERFNFDELLIFILTNLYLKKLNQSKSTFKIKTDPKVLSKFVLSLPFKLTADQKKAIDDVTQDFQKTYPMSRLLQGDVGSGKTVVALAGAHLAIKSGYKVAYLAPTLILARQHFETAKKLMPRGTKIILLTSANKTKDKISEIKEADLIIGTHAIIQKDIEIPELALVIVDEQHRFGVEQREVLLKDKKQIPHLLSLSATPIPRTLAHIVFGNLDISTIKTKPIGRLPIKTYLIPDKKRADSYEFINNLIAKGQQAFVVCPLIEEKEYFGGTLFDEAGSKAVEAEIKNLQKTILGRRNIEMLHGRMKGADKEDKMQRMQEGKLDVLVSTSVVEVGVDVATATVMLIEEADQFGLSQLHQFRGRVGRSNLQSYCFLFTQRELNEKTRERLKTFVRNSDGFKLSEMDLKQRGPGAIFGTTQSGFEGLNPLWFENSEILKKASRAANDLLGQLEKMPELFKEVKEKLQTKHLE